MDNEKKVIIENVSAQGTPIDVSAQEVWELRSALNREHAPLPDMRSEWEKLSMRIAMNVEENVSVSMQEASQQSIANAQTDHIGTITPDEQSKHAHTRGATTKIMYFLSGIAATLAVFFIINLFGKDGEQTTDDDYFFTANNDQQEVMLTDGNGAHKTLKESSLALKDHAPANTTQPQKTKKEKLLTLTTPRGKDYQVTLADGTKVWMNAESKLEFPETFTGNNREVILHGEAFFEVAKDAKHPFIVKTDYFTTRVLGTTFNVKAYSDMDANLVLIEGSVKVKATGTKTGTGTGKEVTLKPGEQVMLNAQHSTLSVKEVDTYPYTQWREGFFYFERETLFEIMQALGRWYNVNIAFDDPEKMNVRLHFVCNRSQSIADAVRYLDAMGVVDVKYEGGVISIK